MRALPLIVLGVAACGGPSYHSHSIESRELSSANRKCGYDAARIDKEQKVKGDLSSYWLPCWDDAKAGPRYRAPTDRATVARLAKVEATHCIGLFPQSLERSPFAQREAIEEVIPHRLGSSIVGAHIVFKRIPGLTVSWMRRVIACHQARWATLGRPADYLAGDPTIIDGAEVVVSEAEYRIVVRIATRSATDADLVLKRAKQLVADRLAKRP